jgi:hypothetical protein
MSKSLAANISENRVGDHHIKFHSLDEQNQNSKLLELTKAEVAKTGLSEFARRLEVDASNLNKIVEGNRKLSRQLAVKCERYFRASQASYAEFQGRYN